MHEASKDYLMMLLTMYAEKGEKETFRYLKRDLKRTSAVMTAFLLLRKQVLWRLARISCMYFLKLSHTSCK